MRIFCMTVGAGDSGAGKDDKGLENLANALSLSISHYNPEKIVFFCSERSESLLQKIKEISVNQKNPIKDYEVKIFVNIDDFNKCYNEICEVFSKYPNDEIIMDYTSGTKTMVAALVVAALLYKKTLSLTSGERDGKGKVYPKSSRPYPQPLYEAYDKIHFENVKRDFNEYRFDTALESMDEIVKCEWKSGLTDLITGYKKWDLMEWNEASGLFKDVEPKSSISEKIVENRKFVNNLVNLYNKMDPKNKEKNSDISAPRNPKEPYVMILADLLNNAQRRITEGKYDDAVSRLYRSTELISQIMLIEKGIDEINDRIYFPSIESQIKNPLDLEKYRDRIEKTKDKIPRTDGSLRKDMGVKQKFQLLKDIGDERGWNHYSKLRSDMENRNQSIMAHGLKPVGKVAADRFYTSVLEFAYDIFTKKTMERLMQQSQFPKL